MLPPSAARRTMLLNKVAMGHSCRNLNTCCVFVFDPLTSSLDPSVIAAFGGNLSQ